MRKTEEMEMEKYDKWYTLEIERGMAVSRALFPTKAKAVRAGKAMSAALNTEVRVWKGCRVHPSPETPVLWFGSKDVERAKEKP